MIRKIRYSDIDFEKYSACLESSVQKNWYARREVLDELSGNWHILVLNDYEAVMPVSIKKKLGINLVSMPLFCQQLGVFSKKDFPEINERFLQFLNKYYIVFFYSFNDKNAFFLPLKRRKNYVIGNTDYSILRRQKYFKGRKSTVKCSQHLLYRELCDFREVLSFIQSHFKGLSKKNDFEKLVRYLDFLREHQSLQCCGAYQGEQLINVALIVTETDQLSLLALINDDAYKKENGASFLIDKILHTHIHEKSFNFMGSNLRGIEIFFKSFGAELHEYCYTENRFLKRFV
ncbi:hypothetical protein [uncultured Chryseobacterium sp.]|uniref:hypothetical protein n=1 Tax=uncultured Chryseobacterium sp. TaxID=259322 RepID=UPI0025FA83A0|nr:hypothetical protein [uncultured Chryseobacterium sp.]